jgi:hypothetical protein
MIIILTDKPTTGRMDRVCHVCGDTYNGWNFVACRECEAAHNYTVELAY